MDYARYLAASLFYLTTQTQRDAAGLIVFDDEVRSYIRASTRQGQLHRLLSGLENAEPRARTDYAKPLLHFQNFLRKRGMVVVISDFFESPEKIVRTIEPLRYHGNEVVLFHVLDPQELKPELNEPVLLIDMETQESLEVTPEYGREEYRNRGGLPYHRSAGPHARRGHGLPPARHRSSARRRAARVSDASPGETLMGFLAPWFLAGAAAGGFAHLSASAAPP